MGRARGMDLDGTEADNSDGVRDAGESVADCEGGQASGADILPRVTWDTSLNIYQRMILAQEAARPIAKTKATNGMKYDYITHDDVTARAKDVLKASGVLFFPTIDEMTQDANRTTVKVRCAFINADEPQEKLETIGYGYGNDNQDKGPGKAYSYAVKYALQKALMLNTGEDIETQAIEYTPRQIAQKTEADIKGWYKALIVQIDQTTSFEALKQIKTDNMAMLRSPAVPDKTKEAILEKLDAAIDDAKQALLQEEAADA